MKIIIIGMDNSGKTTLANKLSESLGYPLVVTFKGTKPEMKECMLKNLIHKNVIFERFPLFDELVYGNILRGGSKFTLSDEIYDLLKKDKNLCIIYCRPSKDNILNFGSREQMKGVIEQSNDLIVAWDMLFLNRLMVDFRGRCIRYDYELQTVDNLKSYLLNIYK